MKFTITGVKVLDRAAAPPPAPGDVPLAYLPGTTWTIEFVSDTPVTPQQFFAFTNEVSQRIPVEIISSRPIDPSHFAVTIRPTEAMEPGDVWMDIPLPGVLYQTLRAYSGSYRAPDAPVPAPANGLAPVPTPTPAPAPIEEEKKKKKISTAAIVVIGVAVVAVGGGAVYAATRKKKKKKRRRRAA